MLAVEFGEQPQLGLLNLGRRRSARQVANRFGPGPNADALVRDGQEVRTPRLRAGVRKIRGQHHERREVLIDGSQPVADPRADAGPLDGERPGMNARRRLKVLEMPALERTNHTQIVDTLRQMRKQLADLRAAPAVTLERELRAEQRPPFVQLSGIRGEFRFVVERFEVRHAARHEQEDHPLGPPRKVRRLGR